MDGVNWWGQLIGVVASGVALVAGIITWVRKGPIGGGLAQKGSADWWLGVLFVFAGFMLLAGIVVVIGEA
ncbi:hypothetical protein Prum_096610 [Phytohabitans rumicis]|uniref:Uncharacterized protein n=2 Tax=Phytohabitans rumicis TaxID=1076125 RepID=A0A6V8LN12_9ACTN|nr:hypothetical protein Prum_096610 [Phytohabitans rumicis]